MKEEEIKIIGKGSIRKAGEKTLMKNEELKEAREKHRIEKEKIHEAIEKSLASERKRETEKARETPTKDKVKRNARQFLDAWIDGKSSGINRNSYLANVDFRAKKTLFKDVQLHGYEIIAYEEIEGDKVGIHVGVTLNIRGKIRKKRILIYAVKIKNEWKIDLKSLLPS
jgi:hypothetical protein